MKISFYLLSCLLLLFACREPVEIEDELKLREKLEGKWKAKAFSGELHEEWKFSENGWMLQKGYYIEEEDTSYSATTQIEKIGNEVILLSVIKDSNPKVFQAVKVSQDEILFENTDYSNPYRVRYKFIDQNNYQRTISGLEGDSLVVYEFNFQKITESP